MNVTITPTLLHGSVTPPPSKSQAHRLLLAAALADGTSALANVAFSQDIQATVRCLEALGAAVRQEGDRLAVTGLAGQTVSGKELPELDCGESGSTLRFLIPVALAVRGGGVFTGHGRLMERPQEPYFDIFREKGISYEQQDGTLTVKGQLTSGVYTLPGNVSSQFVTGLLYALPLLPGDSEIHLTTPLESADYVYMTMDALAQFGVAVEYDGERIFRVPGNQTGHPAAMTVEADWSNAAFWYAAAYLDSKLDIRGLNYQSAQGDACIGRLYWTLAKPGEAEIDVSGCPDLVPPLAAMAALRGVGQVTRLVNAARLRIKESDRLATVTEVLTALGAEVEEHADHLVITGKDSLPGGVTVSGHNDHRIAMMAAIAATNCAAPVTITGAECVRKSYPSFWDEYVRLGGQITVSE
ncbi:3-phosphoshikimate 1-carboxyvinyltransferase [Pseudoflavonifractor capillosus ATCC 29799]|uniref:3-phosphoshikimate 1-carboxyvinyltransferase n=1 Tax=Pseudoflavonifractor capillosus ATCC 29799 TaxID=411467 RepID=A6NXG5_9FIRM|nr:3-phosphoshikimate 1-carboxyvinyltransferase [Pseudoflavonifractor capillosus]EDM98985.1 3-phosphoshikimate 1-carboxyvinyltransferase [Pseudoflavonifractor capillosus ATCC 29799]